MNVAVLPALSVAVQVTVFEPTVFVETDPQDWEAISDPVSVTTGVTVAVPFKYTGLGETLAVRLGAVLSILIRPKLALAVFPALSVAEPVAVNTPSALKTWSAGHEATPLSASAQVKRTVTVWLVQVPAVYGELSALKAEAVMVGGVESLTMVSERPVWLELV